MVFYLSGYAWVGPVHSCCVFIEHNYLCYVLYMAQFYVQGHLRHIFVLEKAKETWEEFLENESKKGLERESVVFCSWSFSLVWEGKQATPYTPVLP